MTNLQRTLPFTACAWWPDGSGGFKGMVKLGTVPSGQMLVVEAVSGYFAMAGGTTAFPITTLTFGEGPANTRVFSFSSTAQGLTTGLVDHYVTSHATKIYVSSGNTLYAGIENVLGSIQAEFV